MRELKKQAEHLIKSYIGSASATPVNLPGELEHEIMSQYKSRQITNKLFGKAETAIRDLLRYDSYRRFLKSASLLWIEVSTSSRLQLFKLIRKGASSPVHENEQWRVQGISSQVSDE